MTLDRLEVSTVVPTTPERLYDAWMDGPDHSAFTGGNAEVDPTIGGRFTAWDGYISGTTLELERPRRIVQSWRSTEFPEDAPDSRLEVRLEAVDGGTHITLIHSDIPEGQGAQYEEGWREHYFTPMIDFFQRLKDWAPEGAASVVPAKASARKPAKKPAAKKASAKKASAKKASAKKPAAKKPAAKKPAAKRASGKKTAKKAAVKKPSKAGGAPKGGARKPAKKAVRKAK